MCLKTWTHTDSLTCSSTSQCYDNVSRHLICKYGTSILHRTQCPLKSSWLWWWPSAWWRMVIRICHNHQSCTETTGTMDPNKSTRCLSNIKSEFDIVQMYCEINLICSTMSHSDIFTRYENILGMFYLIKWHIVCLLVKTLISTLAGMSGMFMVTQRNVDKLIIKEK